MAVKVQSVVVHWVEECCGDDVYPRLAQNGKDPIPWSYRVLLPGATSKCCYHHAMRFVVGRGRWQEPPRLGNRWWRLAIRPTATKASQNNSRGIRWIAMLHNDDESTMTEAVLLGRSWWLVCEEAVLFLLGPILQDSWKKNGLLLVCCYLASQAVRATCQARCCCRMLSHYHYHWDSSCRARSFSGYGCQSAVSTAAPRLGCPHTTLGFDGTCIQTRYEKHTSIAWLNDWQHQRNASSQWHQPAGHPVCISALIRLFFPQISVSFFLSYRLPIIS